VLPSRDPQTEKGKRGEATYQRTRAMASERTSGLIGSMTTTTTVLLLGVGLLGLAHGCNLGMLRDIDGIAPICCGSMSAADCSDGFPARCSPACAELLVPFWDDCAATMQMMGAGFFIFDVHAMSDFMSPCQQTAALTASASQSCAAPPADGGGSDGVQLESWVEEVNDACCSQHGINVCRDGDAVPWQ
jgi:hypothetical protein